MLDTNERFFNDSIDLTFIEPYPELFLSLLKQKDLKKIKLLDEKLNNVKPEIFAKLAPGDFLFIDSTHVSKTGSDVNHIFANLLPLLRKGVYIHFHDIPYPFEYPEHWVYEGRCWNEAYILKAFLQYNRSFEITLFSTYLQIFYKSIFKKEMPRCLEAPGGQIWIKKSLIKDS
jgi:hypothetical protein